MRVMERQAGDVGELARRARAERNALQRDRYRAVLLALDGDEAVEIARTLSRSRAAACRTGSTPTATAGSTTCGRARAPAARPSCHASVRRN